MMVSSFGGGGDMISPSTLPVQRTLSVDDQAWLASQHINLSKNNLFAFSVTHLITNDSIQNDANLSQIFWNNNPSGATLPSQSPRSGGPHGQKNVNYSGTQRGINTSSQN